jgi:hypothetical protein
MPRYTEPDDFMYNNTYQTDYGNRGQETSTPATTPVTTPATTPVTTPVTTPADAKVYTASDGTEFTDQNAYAVYASSLIAAGASAAANAAAADLANSQMAYQTQMYNQQMADNARMMQENKRTATTTALDDFKSNLKFAGLDSLADVIDSYIKQDLTAAQVKINITKTPEYAARFPGMKALQDKNMAINEATYISMERGYDQTMRAYGLNTDVLGTRERLGGLIANQVSPVEFENRVSTAADRVSKNTDVLAALQNYYQISPSSAITWLLDPKVGMDLINKEIRAAEIGAAANQAGFKNFGAGVAESFVNASGKEDLTALKTDFGKAFNFAQQQGRLEDIEGTDKSNNDISAIKTILEQNQSEMLQSQQRAQREVARFSGGTGVGNMSLRSASGI